MKKRVLKAMSVMLVAATLVTGVGFNEVVNVKADTVYDENGYDADGYDAEGYDINGYDRDGYNKYGYDKDGYDRDGYDYRGLDKDGYNRDGYNAWKLDRDGYDKDGYDEHGLDRNGYDRDGYKNGYNDEGYNRNGYDRNGYDKDGYKSDGYNKDGYDRNGYDKNGYDVNGYNKEGYDKNGYNKEGYDRNGYDKKGYDKDGYDKNGYDKNHYDKNGKYDPAYAKDPYKSQVLDDIYKIIPDKYEKLKDNLSIFDNTGKNGKKIIDGMKSKIKKNSGDWNFTAKITPIAVKNGYGYYKLTMKYNERYNNYVVENTIKVFPTIGYHESPWNEKNAFYIIGTKNGFKNIDGVEYTIKKGKKVVLKQNFSSKAILSKKDIKYMGTWQYRKMYEDYQKELLKQNKLSIKDGSVKLFAIKDVYKKHCVYTTSLRSYITVNGKRYYSGEPHEICITTTASYDIK